jgi:succinate-semialdehyde dehydrogenase / glutarate-semialdehyde dehydrogenase
VALVGAVVAGEALAVEVATDELVLVATEIDACCVIVTVFDPLDPHPARTTTSANPVNAPIVLVTIDSLYADQPTGRFQDMTTITASEEQRILDEAPKQLYIGGEWRDGNEGTLAVEDPSTGETIADIADASVDDAKAALDAAVDASAEWAATAPRDRGEILRRAFETIIERADELALLMTLEMGKPVSESKSEIVYAAEFLRWFSEQAVRIDGRFSKAPNGQGRLLTMQQPVGPCLLITPWNFPLAMGTRKVGPAIAAGCTMVVKPAQQTPLSMLMLAKILEESGLPGGVLNLITASSASRTTGPLIADDRLRKLSFTGSTEIGRQLMKQASDTLLRLSMELGGNAPFIVFEDADVDDAVDGAMIAKMRNIGEACTAANRFHVASSIADEFADKLAERMGAMKVGRGTEDGVEVGPLVDAKQRDKVAELVEDAVGKGAKTLTGGHALDGAGYFYDPTVLSEIPDNALLLKEEIFGPVAPVKTFESEDEAIAAANDTEFGLVSYVYTKDLKRALRVVERLETGMIGLNQGLVSNPAAPFGGVKQSGFGREGGYEGIEEYLETKYVAINL